MNRMYGILGDIDHDVTRQLMNRYSIPIEGVSQNEDGTMDEHMLVRKTFTVKHPTNKFIETDIEVTSRADGRYPVIDDEPSMLVEIKGTGFYPYKYLQEEYERGGIEAVVARVKKKHPTWYKQMQVTMALSGFTRCYLIVKDRSTGTLGMWNSKTGEREGIIIDFDEEVWLEILQRFAYVKRKAREGEPPPPEFSAKSNECKYCDFSYLCHEAEVRRTKGLEPAVVYPGPQVEEHNDRVQEDETPGGGDQREDA